MIPICRPFAASERGGQRAMVAGFTGTPLAINIFTNVSLPVRIAAVNAPDSLPFLLSIPSFKRISRTRSMHPSDAAFRSVAALAQSAARFGGSQRDSLVSSAGSVQPENAAR